MTSTSLESESGRIPIRVYGALADSLQPKERVLSRSFLEAASCVCTKTSYRDAADILNRFLGRTNTNTIKLRTLSDSIGRIGAEISEELSNVTEHISAGKQSFLPGTRLPDRWCTGSQEPYPVSLSIPSLYGHP